MKKSSPLRPTVPPASPPPSAPVRVLLWYRKGAGLHFSGPGRTAFHMYRQAQPDRFRVTLVHGWPEQARYELFEDQVCLGYCGESVGRQLVFLARARSWLRRHARHFDVFHGLSGYRVTLQPALQAQRLGLPAAVKLIAWRADMADKPGWKTWLGVSSSRRRQLAQLEALIAIAPAIYDELIEYGVSPARIARIPNGVDVQLYRPAIDTREKSELREHLGWADVPTLLFAGGINRRKQPQLLVEALGKLKAWGKDAQLMLAGPHDDPQLVASMRDSATHLGVAGRVHWLGACQDMAPLYRAADVFCLPSRLEGMPNAVLEAMASGIPSLVTAIPGSIDLVDDAVTGRHVAASADSIAASARDYLDAPELAASHGQAARQKAEQQFDVRVVLAAHERLFRAMLSGREPASASLF